MTWCTPISWTAAAEDAVTAEWRYVSTIDSTDYTENNAAFQRRVVQRGDLLLS